MFLPFDSQEQGLAAGGGDHDGGCTPGFVRPAGDALEGVVDRVKEVWDRSRPSRYAVRVWGDALRGRGILPGDTPLTGGAGL